MIDKLLLICDTSQPLDLIIREPRRAVEVTLKSIVEGVFYFARRTEIAYEDIYVETDDITTVSDSSVANDGSRPIVFAKTANIVKIGR